MMMVQFALLLIRELMTDAYLLLFYRLTVPVSVCFFIISAFIYSLYNFFQKRNKPGPRSGVVYVFDAFIQQVSLLIAPLGLCKTKKFSPIIVESNARPS